jgi:hypothetical protein
VLTAKVVTHFVRNSGSDSLSVMAMIHIYASRLFIRAHCSALRLADHAIMEHNVTETTRFAL